MVFDPESGPITLSSIISLDEVDIETEFIFSLQDDDLTQQLLIYELKEWSNQTCLSLAITANHKEFVAHPCCQVITLIRLMSR